MIFNTFNFAIVIIYRRFKESLEILFFILNVASIFLSFYFSFAIQEKHVNLIATLIFHFARTRARRAGFKRITSSSLLLSLVASRYFIPRYDCILHSNVLRDEHDNFLLRSKTSDTDTIDGGWIRIEHLCFFSPSSSFFITFRFLPSPTFGGKNERNIIAWLKFNEEHRLLKSLRITFSERDPVAVYALREIIRFSFPLQF